MVRGRRRHSVDHDLWVHGVARHGIDRQGGREVARRDAQEVVRAFARLAVEEDDDQPVAPVGGGDGEGDGERFGDVEVGSDRARVAHGRPRHDRSVARGGRILVEEEDLERAPTVDPKRRGARLLAVGGDGGARLEIQREAEGAGGAHAARVSPLAGPPFRVATAFAGAHPGVVVAPRTAVAGRRGEIGAPAPERREDRGRHQRRDRSSHGASVPLWACPTQPCLYVLHRLPCG